MYQAAGTAGQFIDFLLAARRGAYAAPRFFRKAIRRHGEPEVMTIDKVAPVPPLWQCSMPTNRGEKYHY